MVYNPNIAPRNINELETCVDYYYNLEQEKYNQEINELTEQAINSYSQIPDTEDKLDFDQYLAYILSSVNRPQTKEEIKKQFLFYIEQENPVIENISNIYDCDYKVGNKYWNIALAKWVSTPVNSNKVIILDPPTESNLRETIKLYSEYDSRIELGPDIMTTEELFVKLRKERDEKLKKYDEKIMQLERLIRENPDNTNYSLQRIEWDNYATDLCNLPSEDGAPWDGGGENTPWPNKPAN